MASGAAPQRIFLAGASGAVGSRLGAMLVAAGHRVWGMTRSAQSAAALSAAGMTPVVADVYDRDRLMHAMREAQPEVVIHQLTDLPKRIEGPPSEGALRANARVRVEGTRHLAEAAIGAGARRLIAQSVAWMYAPGAEPHPEGHPLNLVAAGTVAISLAGIVALERATLGSTPLEGVVLRYGQFYGPGTWHAGPVGLAPVHVDAAAHAALLSVGAPHTGIFNVAEETGFVSSERARRLLGWDPAFRLDHP